MAFIVVVIIFIFAYKRYVPVVGIAEVQRYADRKDTILLDLRNYQTTSKDMIPDAVNIPYAYLKRYYKEIPNKKLLIVASDSIEKNLAIRFLQKRKFEIHGFMILNEKKSDKHWNMDHKQKTS